MSRDVLELFGDLPDYPGKRKPKNRPDTALAGRDTTHDPFAGVPVKYLTIKGERREMFTVGNAAKVLGRTAQTLRKWERKGWIPAPTYRTVHASGSSEVNIDAKGYRLYSREQVDTLWNILNELDLLGDRTKGWQDSKKWLLFITQVKARWPR